MKSTVPTCITSLVVLSYMSYVVLFIFGKSVTLREFIASLYLTVPRFSKLHFVSIILIHVSEMDGIRVNNSKVVKTPISIVMSIFLSYRGLFRNGRG